MPDIPHATFRAKIVELEACPEGVEIVDQAGGRSFFETIDVTDRGDFLLWIPAAAGRGAVPLMRLILLGVPFTLPPGNRSTRVQAAIDAAQAFVDGTGSIPALRAAAAALGNDFQDPKSYPHPAAFLACLPYAEQMTQAATFALRTNRPARAAAAADAIRPRLVTAREALAAEILVATVPPTPKLPPLPQGGGG